MLATLRRRAVSGGAVVVAAGALVFTGGTSAYADASSIAPFIPQVASAAAGVCLIGGAETLGTACAVAGGAALIATGAYFAWSNLQQILNYSNPQAAGDTGTGPSGNLLGWSADLPPTGQPYDSYGSQDLHAFDAVELQPMSYQYFRMFSWCVDAAGNVTGPNFGSADQGGGSGPAFHHTPNWLPCDVAGLRVVQIKWVEDSSGSQNVIETWSAGGTWAQTRQQVTSVTCTTPGGSSTTTSSTTTYGATGATTGSVPVAPCPSGTYTSHVTVQDQVPGLMPHTVVDWHTNAGIESTYPNCFTGSSPGNGGCTVTVTYQGTACTSAVSACENWYTNAGYGTPGYGCLWGPYSIPMSSCTPLRYAYAPGNTIDTGTGLPKNPTPAPSATTTAGTSTFPSTGPNPLPSPSASASGWVQPQPFPTPTGSTTPVPLPPPVVGPTPSSGNCLAAAWSWNPLSWVVVPVECALTWAFVPDQAVVQQAQTDMSHAWTTSGTGTFVTGAFSMLTPLSNLTNGDSGACGLTVDFPYAAGHVQTLHLLDACTAPMSSYAPWVKGFLTAIVLFDGVIACIRAVGIGFGIGMPPRAPEQLALF